MTTPSILTTLSEDKIAAQLPLLSRDAVSWLRKQVAGLTNPPKLIRPITKEKDRFTRTNDYRKFLIGGMYFFAYNPSTRDDLPYYDKFPLVIPLKREPDGFLGLNLHYLPIRYRIQLLKKMLPLAMYDGEDIRRLRISYDILNSSSRYREFRPCIKKYLLPNIKSRIIKVESNEWDTALFLPVHQFKKTKVQKVWKDSVEQIRK
jgi:hypothetical protein